jgi:hypothetical protein
VSRNGLVDSDGFVGREVDHNVVPLVLARHSDRFVARSSRPTAAAARLAASCSWSSASSARSPP